jgi:hypothetical protein
MPDKGSRVKFVFTDIGRPDDEFDAGRIDIGILQKILEGQNADSAATLVRTPMRSSIVW